MSKIDQTEFRIRLLKPTEKQNEFIRSIAKRKVIRAGRRSGKTTGAATLAVERFLKGRRELYAAPTTDQVETFWNACVKALVEPIEAQIFYKNETEHIIELAGTKQRIRAKTAWNADTLRGDYADDLILDEWQLMNEDAWETVGAPMLLDNDGDAVFIYTPPSLHSRSITKARDPRHAAKMFKKASKDKSGRWAAFHFTSFDNPYLSRIALEKISQDMTSLAMRQEIYAEDIDKMLGALWDLDSIDRHRVSEVPELIRIVVGVDPTGGVAEAGIVAAGIDSRGHGYILQDGSMFGTPNAWGTKVVTLYNEFNADKVAAEKNYGGEMVAQTIKSVEGGRNVPVKLVQSTRGKLVRAEPIAAKYERGIVHHVGIFSQLEEEMCMYVPGAKSPNRMDALVFALTELMTGSVLTRSDLQNVEIEEMEAVTVSEMY